MKVLIKAVIGVMCWIGFFYVYAVKISGSNAGVNVLVFFSSIFILLFYLVWVTGVPGMLLMNIRTRKLLQNGIPAKGRVISFVKSGVRVASNADFPRYGTKLLIEVETPEGGMFQTGTEILLTEHELARISPGMQVKVRYDPGNRKRIAVVSE